LISLEALLERMSSGPAEIYRLPAPRIAVGEPANLVLLDLGASRRVEAGEFRSRSANSWLLGEQVKGKVRMTVAAGRAVYEG
jgi:dihydroorotase